MKKYKWFVYDNFEVGRLNVENSGLFSISSGPFDKFSDARFDAMYRAEKIMSHYKKVYSKLAHLKEDKCFDQEKGQTTISDYIDETKPFL